MGSRKNELNVDINYKSQFCVIRELAAKEKR